MSKLALRNVQQSIIFLYSLPGNSLIVVYSVLEYFTHFESQRSKSSYLPLKALQSALHGSNKLIPLVLEKFKVSKAEANFGSYKTSVTDHVCKNN